MEKIKATPKIPEIAIEKIFEQITLGKIRIGQAIPTEMELSKILGISRGSLREALSTMEYLGVIEGKGNRKIVSDNSIVIRKALSLLKEPKPKYENKNSIFEIFELRKQIEYFIIGLACERATEEDILAIYKSITDFQSNPDIAEANISFHTGLGKATHNQFLSYIEELILYLFESSRKKVCIFMPSRREEILKEHQAIYQAVKARDKEQAKLLVLSHLSHTAEAIKKRGIFEEE